MSVVVTGKTMTWMAVVLLAAVLLYNLPFMLLQEPILTWQIRDQLQSYFKKNGFQFVVGKIRWCGGGTFEAQDLRLTESQTGKLLVKSERLLLRTDWSAIVSNITNPEMVLKEFEVVRPQIQLIHNSDQTWNFSPLFQHKGSKRKTKMDMLIKIRDGYLRFDDYRWGKHRLSHVSGNLDFRKYPLITWNAKANADFGTNLTIQSRGKLCTDKIAGEGDAHFRKLPMKKTLRLLGFQYPFDLKTGIATGSIDFAWEKNNFYLQKGEAVLENSRLRVPWLPHELTINNARTHFIPEEIKVDNSKLTYQKTQLTLAGTVNSLSKSLNAELTSRNARLTDLLEIFPPIANTVITGKADLKLRVAGKIKNPVFEGKASFRQTKVVSNGEVFSDFKGKMTICKNNIRVNKAEGRWDNGAISAQGNIFNIYNPRLDLQVKAKGVVLEQIALVKMAGPELQLCRTVDLAGKFTGFWDQPLFTGAAYLDHMAFCKVPAQKLNFRFEWEPMAMKARMLSMDCDIWQGHITAKGSVTLDDKAAQWNLIGKVAGVNLEKINLLPKWGIVGQDITANAMMKGSWRYTDVFEPGTIMGTVRGKGLKYQNIDAEELSLVYSLKQGVFSVNSLQLKAGEGQLFGNLTFAKNRLTSRLNVENFQLNQLLPQDQYPVTGRFKGELSLEGPLDQFTGTLNGDFTGLTWNSKKLGDVNTILEYHQQNQEVIIDHLTMDNPMGEYCATGKVILAAATPKLDIVVTSDNLNLKGLAEWLPENSEIKLNGLGKARVEIAGSLPQPSFAGTIQLLGASLNGIKIDQGLLTVRGDLNQINITQCELSNSESHVILKGLVERDQVNLKVDGNFSNLDIFGLNFNGNNLKGKINLEGSLKGSMNHPVLNAKVRGENVSFGSLAYSLVTADIRWMDPELEIYNTQLSEGERLIRATGKIYTSQPMRFDLGMDVVDFDIRDILQLARLEKVNAAGKFSGQMAISGTPVAPEIRLDGGITEANINGIPIGGELALSYANNKLLVEKVGLVHQTGTFLASGVWEMNKSLKLKGRLNQFPLQTINPLIKASGIKLNGLAKADIQLEWSEALLKCGYQLDINELQVNEENIGRCLLEGSLDEAGMQFDSGNLVVKNGNLRFSGFVPWPEAMLQNLKLAKNTAAAKQPLKLQLDLNNVPVSLLNTYAIGYQISGGECNGQLTVGGLIEKPELSGNIVCSNTKVEMPEVPFTVDSLAATVQFEKNRANIKKAVGLVDKGRIDCSGEIDFSNLAQIKMDLDFLGSKVYFKNSFYDGFSDFNVNLAGQFDEALLMGNISLYNCKMGGLKLMSGKKGKNEWNPRIDLRLNVDKDVRYRQIGVADVTVKGALHVKGTLAEPALAGEVTTNQGVATLYSQTFKVNQGKVVFSYSQGFNPYVDIEASLMTPKAMVYMKVKGQVGTEIMPVLSAQPALTQKEIFALLNWSDLSGDEPLTVDGVVVGNMNMVTDTLFGDALSKVRNWAGVDYLCLETDYRKNDYRIYVGDFLTEKLFVSYTRKLLTESDTEEKEKWNFDYHLTSKFATGYTYSPNEGRSWRLSYTIKL